MRLGHALLSLPQFSMPINSSATPTSADTPPRVMQPATTPLVSVLIRSMDRAFLSEALDSIALQTYPNIEVIVVAVRPAHQPLASHCGPFPVRLVATNAPVPRSAAANRALAAAKGDLLIFLDDDDWMMPGHIARLAQVLDRLPQAQAVYTGIGLVDGAGKPLGQTFDLPFDPIRQLAGNLTPIHAVLFRSTVLAAGCHFDETLDQLEDWDFWLQLSKLAPMVHLPGVSAVYRIHESSGVHHDSGPQGASAGRIYAKWESQWTPRQLGQLMQRVWAYPELEARIAETQAQVLATKRELATSQATAAACIGQQNATMQQLANNMALLIAQQKSQVEALMSDLQMTRAHLAAIEADRQTLISERLTMIHSSSWKLTRPLRWLGNGLKRSPLQRLLAPNVQPPLPAPAAIASETVPDAIAPHDPYIDWLRWESTHRAAERTRLLADVQSCKDRGIAAPVIAVVMPCYNPPIDLLNAAIQSVVAQSWTDWTLHIADDASTKPDVRQVLNDWAGQDARIVVSFAEVNGHISKTSNLALSTVQAPFFALLDQDDLLAEDALLHVAVQVMQQPLVAIIYSDEDKIDTEGNRSAPYFKPDFNRDLLLGQNTVSHLGTYSTALVRSVGGFREGYEGSQDHDLALRCIEHLRPDQVLHIPRVLYHWRVHAGSTAASVDEKPYALIAGMAAIQDHLDRTEPGTQVSMIEGLNFYRVRFPVPQQQPTVAVIVPTRNGLSVLKPCIEGLLHGTDYAAMQIVIIDNGSDDPETLAQLEAWANDSRVTVRRDTRPFNYSALNNAAVAEVNCEFVLLLNNDISMIHRDWLQEMVSQGLRKGVGAVGAALWYPNDTLQHGGVILGVGGVANHAYKGSTNGHTGYFGRARLLQSLTAVTAACLLVRKDLYQAVGGLNERDLSVAFNDVDFCIRLTRAGYRTIWTPFAQLYHHESVSRGSDQTPDKIARFQSEVHYMMNTWGEDLLYDPAYNPNLTLDTADFAIAIEPRPWPRLTKGPSNKKSL